MRDTIEELLDLLEKTEDPLAVLRRLNWLTVQWSECGSVRGTRAEAAEALVSPSKLEHAVDLAMEEDSSIRSEAIYLLGQLGCDRHLDCLRKALWDPGDSSEIKVAACEAIATIGGPAAVELLTQSVSPGNPIDVVQASLLGLQCLPVRERQRVLGVSLSDADPVKQMIAAVAQRHGYRGLRLLAESMWEQL